MKLYCLCKLPHDGERPMLQCDSCRDWFHWDCVGLTPPGDDEDDEEIAPANFQCPGCCIKVGPLGSFGYDFTCVIILRQAQMEAFTRVQALRFCKSPCGKCFRQSTVPWRPD